MKEILNLKGIVHLSRDAKKNIKGASGLNGLFCAGPDKCCAYSNGSIQYCYQGTCKPDGTCTFFKN
ncbi:hypothetical protein D1816_03285 [Aquimarina sp. AD10]|uniref:Uncharacterized protein n=1 Tax=Aquimarina aggregata TaxID=1642818 RepID=A0A163CNA6_9FLAO|nr:MULTISPECIES: hypothetical protein [Aquimarina]AXT59411.1 hypothetical protein D1816_03285 [Aquimarina sp. AD10]KZS42591.1 hypothetical protein AWE51_03865 [Aquimarina aggregata]RKM92387.1 hypothetical protein D7033_21230 [Aquimarina sp. AD10]